MKKVSVKQLRNIIREAVEQLDEITDPKKVQTRLEDLTNKSFENPANLTSLLNFMKMVGAQPSELAGMRVSVRDGNHNSAFQFVDRVIARLDQKQFS